MVQVWTDSLRSDQFTILGGSHGVLLVVAAESCGHERVSVARGCLLEELGRVLRGVWGAVNRGRNVAHLILCRDSSVCRSHRDQFLPGVIARLHLLLLS